MGILKRPATRVIAVGLCLWVGMARAATLPYSVRTQSFNGVSTTVRGDTRTIGMGGATLGLADTFLAAKDNPAGLAAALSVGDDNFAHSRTNDANVQDYNVATDTINAGLAGNFYPWGFSIGYVLPYREQASYDLPNSGALNPTAQLNVTVQEVRLAAARWYAQQRFSLGISLNLGQAETGIEFPSSTRTEVFNHAYAVGVTVGASKVLARRILLGASLSTPMHYSGDDEANQHSPLPGFFKDVNTPWTGGVGVGWVPNRFFRADASLFAIGTTSEAALVRNDRERVGAQWTLQPRFGAAYVFCDFRNLRGTIFAGGYLETPRLSDAGTRFHRTLGAEFKPWIFTIGVVGDVAPGYQNTAGSIGIDVFKVLEQLALIPPANVPRNGLLPDPFFYSDVGLSRPLMDEWRETAGGMDAVKIGLDIPRKIGESIGSGSVVKEVVDSIKELPGRIKNEAEEMTSIQKRRSRDLQVSPAPPMGSSPKHATPEKKIRRRSKPKSQPRTLPNASSMLEKAPSSRNN